jgi:cellulose synthase/poly-beta-1,6-N-acetylglucosamine synthase-like glycosyltransferase
MLFIKVIFWRNEMGMVFEGLILTIVGLMLFIYAGYPLVIYILGIFMGRKKVYDDNYFPDVILIISAYNEERVIRDKIENSLQLDYPEGKLTIIVASDGSSDKTDRIVSEYKDQNVLLKTFEKRKGKSATLNSVMKDLDGEIIAFSDANALYRKDAIKKMVRNFVDERVGCVVGQLKYLNNGSFIGEGESLYWKYELFLNKLESKLGSVLVGTGTIFAMKRELFTPVLSNVANDFQIPAEVASSGHYVIYEEEAIACEKPAYFFKEEFARKFRIIIRGITGFRKMNGGFGGALRKFQFITRKLFRWFVGLMLPLLYFSNLMVLDRPFLVVFFVLQNVFYAMAAVGALVKRGKIQSRLFFIPFYFVMVNSAAVAALFKYVCGGRLSAWEKAETTRDMHERPISSPSLSVLDGRENVPLSEESGELENIEHIT